ncbi:hypothetical protein U1Q18_049593 [Sarracenia purpurea var. burkii]
MMLRKDLPPFSEVCLQNWWLIKVEMDSEGRRLGVGGFASSERQVMRAFCSAAIAKRHDTVTLETADGITITIVGLINRFLTVENGFPSEVCNHFLFGFPFDWEEYAGKCCGEESVNGAFPSRISSLDGFDMASVDSTDSPPLSIPLDDLSVTQLRDIFLMSGNSRKCVLAKSIVNDIMQKYGGNGRTPSDCNGTFGKQNRKEDDCNDRTPKNLNNTKVDQKSKDDGRTQYSTEMGTEKPQEIATEFEMGMDVNSLSSGATTRSMTTLKKVGIKHDKNFSPNTFGSQRGGIVNRGNASSESRVSILSDPKVEATKNHDNSTVRRSSRLKSLSDPFSTSETAKNQLGGLVSRRNGEEIDIKQIPDKLVARKSDRRKHK